MTRSWFLHAHNSTSLLRRTGAKLALRHGNGIDSPGGGCCCCGRCGHGGSGALSAGSHWVYVSGRGCRVFGSKLDVCNSCCSRWCGACRQCRGGADECRHGWVGRYSQCCFGRYRGGHSRWLGCYPVN